MSLSYTAKLEAGGAAAPWGTNRPPAPLDATLYAAAGKTVITPTSTNHPEQIYLAGVVPSRVCSGVHDDLYATALALRQGEAQAVIVSLDFIGFTRSRIREIQERLAAHGLNPESILIASTHTHEGPDTLGVYGPNTITSGVSPEYIDFVQDAVSKLVLDVWQRLEPVVMKSAVAKVNDPRSNFPTLMADLRQPAVTVPFLSAAQFIGRRGNTVATLINWHAHPEVMIKSTLISADFPGYLRPHVSSRLGGETIYISGALGGLATPTGVKVPARDEQDAPILDPQGNPVYLLDGTWEKTRSLGLVIGDLAIAALQAASLAIAPQLQMKVEPLLLPVLSPTFIAAYYAHILEFEPQDLITDQPDYCGWLGCSDDRLAYLKVGPVEMISAPGETFPETFIGRGASTYNYGPPWGISRFPRMSGLITAMTSPTPMFLGVCGNEIAYLVPESDWHPYGHPAHYEEGLCLSRSTETLYHQAAQKLIRSAQ